MVYERLLRPLIFRAWNGDPENAHEHVMAALRRLGRIAPAREILESIATVRSPRLSRELWGLRFRNPVGLAGGFDKNAVAVPGFEALGFGFIEIGTITRHPQPGNPKPRVFRFPEDEALINRFGFNNDGADAVAARLAGLSRRADVPLGVSLGKSKITPVADAVGDYLYSLRALYMYGDYFAVNVSSPNTPGLRQLQDRELLDELLAGMMAEREKLHREAMVPGRAKPVLVKIAPDLEPAALEDLLQVCTGRGVDGLIATNTTLSRSGLTRTTNETGGLSGRPLHTRALEVVRAVRAALPQMPIIGVGGIMDGQTALSMLEAGADLLQVYTGLIYKGPMLARHINRGILRTTSR